MSSRSGLALVAAIGLLAGGFPPSKSTASPSSQSTTPPGQTGAPPQSAAAAGGQGGQSPTPAPAAPQGQLQPPPPAPSVPVQAAPENYTTKAPPPAIRTTTRLVQVSVVVHDGHGNPIADLTKDDFVVYDEKQAQEIRIFSMETNSLPPNPPPALPANTYTNRFERQGDVPTSITVILFDGLNTRVSDQQYARQQVVKFLREQIKPQDRVAIYSLGDRLDTLHDFSNDSASLLAALDNYEGKLSPLPQASEPQHSDNPNAGVADFLDNAYLHEANFYMRNRVHQTVEALTAIANHVGTLPGRKNLIWVSAAFPFSLGFEPGDQRSFDTQELYADDVQTAARALTNANVAVYPVDARGLFTSPSISASRGSSPPSFGSAGAGGTGSGGHLRGSAMASEKQFSGPTHVANFDTMNELADDTGGKAYYNTNDLKSSIREAIDDSRVTYELGYYPQGIEWNGKFRAIKVEVKRSGAHVRARKGYFALPEPALTPQLRQAIIAISARSPLEPTGIGMNVAVEKEPGTDRKLKTVTYFDLHDFALEQKDGRWQGAVDTVYIQMDSQNQILDASDQTFQLHLDPALYQRLLAQGVTNSKEVLIRPGAIELKVMYRDATTGTIGGVSVPLAKYFPTTPSTN